MTLNTRLGLPVHSKMQTSPTFSLLSTTNSFQPQLNFAVFIPTLHFTVHRLLLETSSTTSLCLVEKNFLATDDAMLCQFKGYALLSYRTRLLQITKITTNNYLTSWIGPLARDTYDGCIKLKKNGFSDVNAFAFWYARTISLATTVPIQKDVDCCPCLNVPSLSSSAKIQANTTTVYWNDQESTFNAFLKLRLSFLVDTRKILTHLSLLKWWNHRNRLYASFQDYVSYCDLFWFEDMVLNSQFWLSCF